MTLSATRTSGVVTTTEGITASSTQTQGQQPLTTTINEVSVCGTAGDVVTLMSAQAGRAAFVLNDGAENLQVYPASGDNLGAGVDASQVVEPNESVEWVCYGTGNWHKAASTETVHAEMHDQDNTDAFVVTQALNDQVYHSNGIIAGDLLGWTFDAGGAGTSFPIASIADGAVNGVDIAVTTTGTHGLAAGDIISQSNLTNAAYEGVFVVKAIISTTIYEVAAVYGSTDTGTMDQAATLTCNVGSSGIHIITVSASAVVATNNETFDFAMMHGATAITGAKIRRKFGTNADFGSFSDVAIVTVADGDKMSFCINNEDTAGNITLRNFTMVIHRL